MDSKFDIVIAGGGLVGATLAVALDSAGLRVAVVEAFAPSPAQPSFDDRATALSRSSRDILATLDLWQHLEAPCPIESIRVSDRGRFGATRLDSARHGVEAFGYVVENREIGDVLWNALSAGDVEVACPARVAAVEEHEDAIAVAVTDDAGTRRLHAALLVVAEGAGSTTRDKLMTRVEREDYGRTGLVANIATEQHHAHRAWERFTPDGPLAVLPLSGGRCNVVWSLPSSMAEALRDDESAYVAALQEAFGFRLGRILRAGARHAYPLTRTSARPLYGARWVLVGNAANAVHPVAGQGLNLGLRDVAALAELIVDARDELDGDVLSRYTQWRAPDHRRVLTMTDSLARVFANPAAPVGLLRDAALVAMQVLPPARRWFARRGMGYTDKLPRLARGVKLL